MFSNISLMTYGRTISNSSNWFIHSFVVNRIYYIHSGSVICNCGKNQYSLTPGNLYFFPQNLNFSIHLTDDTLVDHTFFDFYTYPLIVMDKPIEIKLDSDILLQSAMNILIHLADIYPIFETGTLRNDYSPIVQQYVTAFLSLLSEKHKISITNDALINKSIDYIKSNLSTITVDALARLFHKNKNAYIKKFTSVVGCTPGQYIKNYRFNIAISLLKENKLSLSEIADILGYSDASALSHALKNEFGVSSSAFKDKTD